MREVKIINIDMNAIEDFIAGFIWRLIIGACLLILALWPLLFLLPSFRGEVSCVK